MLHTFVFRGLVGLGVGALTLAMALAVRRLLGSRAAHLSLGQQRPVLLGEHSLIGVALGGIVGGLSHALLDGVMHGDMQPFRPFTLENPLYGLAGWRVLYLGCVIAGCIGLCVLLARQNLWLPVPDQRSHRDASR